MATDSVTFPSALKQLKSASARVFLFHGDEGYYVDRLLDEAEGLVAECDRDFNLYTLYAPQVGSQDIIDICHRYPMMADYQVVILKEAQAVSADYFKPLVDYVSAPEPSTVLVIGGRGAQVKSKAFATAVKKGGGVVFESNKLKESALSAAIQDFVKDKGLSIEAKALSMLTDWVGSDLSRLYNEIGKLTVTLGAGAMITPEVIERNIGFSKEFNNFELIAALSKRDVAKAMRIVRYFRSNPKNNPAPVTTTVIFNYFSNMLVAYYAPDKSERGLMGALGFRWPGQLKDITNGMRCYNAAQVVQIIDTIRDYDNHSKGNGSRMDMYDLLCDLVYRILTCDGRLK